MITRRDVAQRAHVSVGTVSNVLNKKVFVKPALVQRVQKAIDELNYIPDYNAKSLASKRSKHLGIALYEMSNPYHFEIIRGIEEYASEHDYLVTIFPLNNNRDKKLDAICERKLEGLINFMTDDFPKEYADILMKRQIALVNFSAENSFTVVNRYEKAMLEYMKKLSDLGHKKVAYIWGFGKERFEVDGRGRAFLEGREKYGFCQDDNLIMFHTNPEVLSQDCGYELCGKLLEQHKDITAIFTYNDLAAMGVIRKLTECGYRCPEDISVIGCDGISLGKYFVPALSTISFDKELIGKKIAEQVIGHIENPQEYPYKTIYIDTEPLLRNSVAAVK